MKTINVSDELHVRLKSASDLCGISIQDLVTNMIEMQFNSYDTEFTIDNPHKTDLSEILNYIAMSIILFIIQSLNLYWRSSFRSIRLLMLLED